MLQSLHSWWSNDTKCDRLSVRSLLADHRLGVSPNAFHWTQRKIDYGFRKSWYGLRQTRKAALKFSQSESHGLIGEDDLIYHTVSGPDGYGGKGHDSVLGALGTSGVRNPFSPSRNIDSLSQHFLPSWLHTSRSLNAENQVLH